MPIQIHFPIQGLIEGRGASWSATVNHRPQMPLPGYAHLILITLHVFLLALLVFLILQEE